MSGASRPDSGTPEPLVADSPLDDYLVMEPDPDFSDGIRESRQLRSQLLGSYRPRPRLRWRLLPGRYVDQIVAYNQARQAWYVARRRELGLPRDHPPSSRHDDPDVERALARVDVLGDWLGVVAVQWTAGRTASDPRHGQASQAAPGSAVPAGLPPDRGPSHRMGMTGSHSWMDELPCAQLRAREATKAVARKEPIASNPIPTAYNPLSSVWAQSCANQNVRVADTTTVARIDMLRRAASTTTGRRSATSSAPCQVE